MVETSLPRAILAYCTAHTLEIGLALSFLICLFLFFPRQSRKTRQPALPENVASDMPLFQQRVIADIIREKGTPPDFLRAVCEHMHSSLRSSPLRFERILWSSAEDFAFLHAHMTADSDEDTGNLRQQALQEIAAGTFLEAEETMTLLCGRSEEAAYNDPDSDDLLLAAARDYGLLAYVCWLRTDVASYRNALGHFQKAEAFAAQVDEQDACWYRAERGRLLQLLALDFDDEEALEQSVAVFRQLLADSERQDAGAEYWARHQASLGGALHTLGQRRQDEQLLSQAFEAYTKALLVFSLEHEPEQWAMLQLNLGSVLWGLGKSEGGARARLDMALEAYGSSLRYYTREKAPFQWAAARSVMGDLWHWLYTRTGDTEHLKNAVTAFEDALSVMGPQDDHLERFRAVAGLGSVLKDLGEAERDPGMLRRSAVLLEEALAGPYPDGDDDFVPSLNLNRGLVLLALSEFENEADNLDEAGKALEAALERMPESRSELIAQGSAALEAIHENRANRSEHYVEQEDV